MGHSDFDIQWRKRFEAYGSSGMGDAEIAGWSDNGLATRFSNFKAVWAGDKPGSVWLDVGCGAGTYTEFLAESNLLVFGFDYSLPSLKKAKERYAQPSGWAVADGLQLPVRSGAVDGVVCFGVAQAVGDVDQLIGELVRVSRAGGQVWLDALNSRFIPSAWTSLVSYVTGTEPRLYVASVSRIRAVFEANGAKLVGVHRLILLPESLQTLQRVLNRTIRKLTWLAPIVSIFCHALVVEARVTESNQ